MTSTPIEIETYVPDNNELVHPSVYKFDRKWNKYSYWMVYTAYPQSNSKFENPSIAVSNDGVTWKSPEGLTNPIAPEPHEDAFNSDATMFYDANQKVMNVIYRERGLRDGKRANRLMRTSSADGIVWTSATVMLQFPDEDVASPCIVETSDSLVLLTNDICNSTSNSVLTLRTCKSLSGPFSEPTFVNVPNTPTDEKFWHFEVRQQKGTYYMLYMICPKGNSGLPGKLFLTTSKDLRTWSVPVSIGANTAASFYKSAFSINGNSLQLWVSYYQDALWRLATVPSLSLTH